MNGTTGPVRRRPSSALNKGSASFAGFGGAAAVVNGCGGDGDRRGGMRRKMGAFCRKASFMKWGKEEVVGMMWYHPVPCVFAASLLFFMAVEYTLRMVPPTSPPFDLGFVVTRSLHRVLDSTPALNSLLAAFNTVFVAMQTTYIVWVWVVEGRPRATISALFMFTCRGILGYSTQLPLPQQILIKMCNTPSLHPNIL